MDTRHLKSFLRIIETGSISRAAISLGISQPSLSQQLLRLEDELGVKLFRRAARGVTATEAGRIFEEHARYMLQSSEQAFENLRSLSDSACGQVTIVAPPAVVRLIGVPLFEAVRQHAPAVTLRLGQGFSINIFAWLEQDKIDLGILYDLGPWPNLTFRPLLTEELFLVGAPGSFGDDQKEVPLDRLAEFGLLLPGLPHALRAFLDGEAARLGFELKVAHQVEIHTQIATLAARGHGFGLLPWSTIGDDVAAGRLEFRRIAGGVLKRTLSLVRKPTRTLTHASVVTEDLTLKVMRSLVANGNWRAVQQQGL